MSIPTQLLPLYETLRDSAGQPSQSGALAKSPSGKEPVRVLHVINGEHYSGAERVQDLLASCLPELGYEVGFACIKPGRFPQERKCQTAALYEVPMRSKIDFRAVMKLVKIIRQHDYRIVHAHTPRTALIGRLVAAIARVPLVYHVHSPTSQDSTHRLRNWFNMIVERVSLTGVSRLITVSESLARHMQKSGYDRQKISTVPNGVPQIEKTVCRGVPKTEWILGTVALFRPRKGTEVLLDALAILRKQGIPVRLRAVGPFETPEYEESLKSQIRRLGLEDVVEWTGFSQDINQELTKIDLFVLPSLFGEGLPMVVLEAMAAGVPVVATKVEGVPEAIRNEIDGMIATAGDPLDLARAITRIVRGEINWAELRQSAQKRQGEKFSDRSMAAGVAQAYQQVLHAA